MRSQFQRHLPPGERTWSPLLEFGGLPNSSAEQLSTGPGFVFSPWLVVSTRGDAGVGFIVLTLAGPEGELFLELASSLVHVPETCSHLNLS